MEQTDVFWFWVTAITQNLLASFIGVLFGLGFAHLVKDRWDKWRYGGWCVIVIKNGREVVNRSISVRKAKEILAEPADLSVFLKGVVSPYGWINCDPIGKGLEVGLLRRDDSRRQIIFNLDCNPSPEDQSLASRNSLPPLQVVQQEGTAAKKSVADKAAPTTQEGA